VENNKYFKQFVDRLDVNQKALDTLKENEITTLGELSKYKKSQLKDMGLLQNEINKIEVELELLGLTLKGSL
jgi:DNA-directed RNA polymerase alpha subunit